MNRSGIVLMALVVCLAGLYVALAQEPAEQVVEPAAADGAIVFKQPSATGNGRFEMELSDSRGIAVVDTQTGQVWIRQSSATKWQDLGSPVGAK